MSRRFTSLQENADVDQSKLYRIKVMFPYPANSHGVTTILHSMIKDLCTCFEVYEKEKKFALTRPKSDNTRNHCRAQAAAEMTTENEVSCVPCHINKI
jgi:hypothetical protein